MENVVDNFYKFVDNTNLFLEESDDFLAYFISDNLLIAMRMISLSINNDEMNNVVNHYNIDESYDILQDILDKELREIPNIQEFKIKRDIRVFL